MTRSKAISIRGQPIMRCPSELVDMVEDFLNKVISLVRNQEEWRGKSTINLIASENVMSPLARALQITDFAHRYAEGEVWHREYQGTRYVDEIEDLCLRLANEVFGAKYVDFRPISGALANLAVFFGLAKPGDSIASLRVPSGGHISFREFGAAGCRGLSVYDIPFSQEDMNIDVEALAELVEKVKPRIITLGGSLFLFPHPVREVSKIASSVGAYVHYDAAHVLGLVAGGCFQNPLEEGADVVTASTHKTFPGPQGGVVFSNREDVINKIRPAIFPGLVSNHHLHRLPSLAVTLFEFKRFGREYAFQVVRNAKALGKALYENGLNVLCPHKGFTESHQIAVDVSEFGGGAPVAKKLEEANIIVNKNLLPWDRIEMAETPSGVRIGSQEVTRYGMREPEMERIAELIVDVIRGKRPLEDIRRDVEKLRREFPKVQYCFDVDEYQEIVEFLSVALGLRLGGKTAR